MSDRNLKELKHIAYAKNGELTHIDPEIMTGADFDQSLRYYCASGQVGKLMLIIRPWKRKATKEQFGFVFAGIVDKYMELHNEAYGTEYAFTSKHQAAHDLKRYSPVMQEYYRDVTTGKMICRIRSKAELNVAEMSQHIEECLAFIKDRFGVVVKSKKKGER